MSVAGYAEKIEDMVAYSSQALYAPNELWKVNQSMFGLRGKNEHTVA